MTEKVITVTASNEVSIRDVDVIDDSMLDGLKKIVGGWIEIVHPRGMERPLCLICDEEGLLKDKPMNMLGSLVYGFAEHGSPIVGDIAIMQDGFRCGEPDIVGFSEEESTNVYNQLLERFSFLKGAMTK